MTDTAPPEQEDLRATVVRSALWVSLDKWGSRGVQLLVFAVLGRLLGAEAFGLLALATAVVAITTVFVDQGFAKALIQRASLEEEHKDAAFWTAMGGAVVLTAAIIVLAGPLSDLLGEPQLAPILQWLSLSLPLGALQTTPVALMERSFQYRGLAIRHLAGAVAGGVAGIACAFAGAGVWSLVVSALVNLAVSSAVLWRVSDWRPRLRFSRRHFKDLWVFGVNVLGINVVQLSMLHGDRIIVGAALGPRALGFYYIGFNILLIVIDATTSVIGQIALPGFARLQHDRERLRNAFYGAIRVSVHLAIPVFVGLAALAPELIRLLFGPGWGPSVPVMQALAALGAINAVSFFDQSLLLAVNRSGLALLISVTQTVFSLAAALVAVQYGIVWVAVAVAARQYLVWPLRIVVLRRVLDISVRAYLTPWLTAVAASAAMFGAVFGLARLLAELPPVAVVALAAPAGALIYAAALRLVAPTTFRELTQSLPLPERLRASTSGR